MQIFRPIIKAKHKLIFILPMMLGLLGFINTVGYGIVFADDNLILLHGAPVLADWSWANLARLFDCDIVSFFCRECSFESQVIRPYYRPVFGLILMIGYKFAGINAWHWRILAIALQMVAAVLAYQVLLTSLRLDRVNSTGSAENNNRVPHAWLAAVGASYFAIHPVQSESVALITAACMPLAAIFMFASLLAYCQARQRQRAALALSFSVFSYLLALLSKEVAIALPAVLVLYELFVLPDTRNWRARLISGIKFLSPFALTTLLYFAMRIIVFGSLQPLATFSEYPDFDKISVMTNLVMLPSLCWHYFKVICWPQQLAFLYPLPHASIWQVLIVIGALSALLIAARGSGAVRIGLIWLIIPLLPMLNITFCFPEQVVQDRFLYLPVCGAGLLLANGLLWLNKRIAALLPAGTNDGNPRPLMTLVAGVLLVVLLGFTIKQNEVWSDELLLWSDAYALAPTSCITNQTLGNLNELANNIGEAKQYYQQALAVCPDTYLANYRLGIIYARERDFARAENFFQRVSRLAPFHSMRAAAHVNLAYLYESLGDKARARQQYRSAISDYQAALAIRTDESNTRVSEFRDIVNKLREKLALD